MKTGLTDYERELYSRQIMIEGWGEEGQSRLKRARIFIAGAGGLGSSLALYLAAAGAGELRICDDDVIELSNLNRQILHTPARIGQAKALSAGQTLQQINNLVSVVPITEHLVASNIERLIDGSDLVVDCLDNFETRYLLNRYCLDHHLPLIHGAIMGFLGQVTVLFPPETGCLACLFPTAPPKTVFPVVGVTPGLIGTIQAMEVIKFITGIGVNLKNRLLLVDGETMRFTMAEIQRDSQCPVCSGNAHEETYHHE